jgi:hypothetical protein
MGAIKLFWANREYSEVAGGMEWEKNLPQWFGI